MDYGRPGSRTQLSTHCPAGRSWSSPPSTITVPFHTRSTPSGLKALKPLLPRRRAATPPRRCRNIAWSARPRLPAPRRTPCASTPEGRGQRRRSLGGGEEVLRFCSHRVRSLRKETYTKTRYSSTSSKKTKENFSVASQELHDSLRLDAQTAGGPAIGQAPFRGPKTSGNLCSAWSGSHRNPGRDGEGMGFRSNSLRKRNQKPIGPGGLELEKQVPSNQLLKQAIEFLGFSCTFTPAPGPNGVNRRQFFPSHTTQWTPGKPLYKEAGDSFGRTDLVVELEPLGLPALAIVVCLDALGKPPITTWSPGWCWCFSLTQRDRTGPMTRPPSQPTPMPPSQQPQRTKLHTTVHCILYRISFICILPIYAPYNDTICRHMLYYMPRFYIYMDITCIPACNPHPKAL